MTKMTNIIDNGTTMDVVRNELLTGLAKGGKFHTTKLNMITNGLEKRIRGGLNQYDEAVAKALLVDIKKALRGC